MKKSNKENKQKTPRPEDTPAWNHPKMDIENPDNLRHAMMHLTETGTIFTLLGDHCGAVAVGIGIKLIHLKLLSLGIDLAGKPSTKIASRSGKSKRAAR